MGIYPVKPGLALSKRAIEIEIKGLRKTLYYFGLNQTMEISTQLYLAKFITDEMNRLESIIKEVN